MATILCALSNANAVPGKRDVIVALPGRADDTENRLQPVLDFDRDGWYSTSAINSDGRVNPGNGATGTPQGQYRDRAQLDNANVYSRRRCNNGICAVMYEYYFEKDQSVGGSYASGHRHN